MNRCCCAGKKKAAASGDDAETSFVRSVVNLHDKYMEVCACAFLNFESVRLLVLGCAP